MADSDWEDESDGSGDWEDEAPGPVQRKKTETGKWAAVGRGALQGATLGFGDEVQGLMGQAMQRGVNILPMRLKDALRRRGVDLADADERDAYRFVRDEDRAANAKAEKDHGSEYLLGNVAGGVLTAPLLPGAAGAKTLGGAMKLGAGIGAAAGLGMSEADLGRGEYGRAALDAAVGGALGAGAGAVGRGAEKLLGAGGRWLAGKGAKRAAAAEAKAAERAADAAESAFRTARSEAGNASTAAYKNVRNIMDAGAEGSLGPEQQAVFERLKKEMGESGLKGLLEDAAAKDAKILAMQEVSAGRAETAKRIGEELLAPTAKVDARELFRSYGEPIVGAYLGNRAGEMVGEPGTGTVLGTAGGLIFGRTRAGKAIANRLAKPSNQMALANALRRAGGLATGASSRAGAASRLPARLAGPVGAAQDAAMRLPAIADLVEDDQSGDALARALRANRR